MTTTTKNQNINLNNKFGYSGDFTYIYNVIKNKSKMEKEFVPYEPSLALKELGFDEPCLGWYLPEIVDKGNTASVILGSYITKWNKFGDRLSVPTFSQAFRWFREKRSCVCEIIRKDEGNHSEFIGWVYIDDRKIDVVSYWDSKSYEEAELACLIKLIEIVKNK